jgi:hypothetical protein
LGVYRQLPIAQTPAFVENELRLGIEGFCMLHSAVLRRTVAVLGIGAAGVSPALPFAAFAFFGATVPTAKVSASASVKLFDGPIRPEDIIDLTGGTGGLPILPPFPPPPIVPPEDIEDGTGGIGGHLP